MSLKRSNVWCGTEAVVRARKLFILAPSGYRFSVVLDTNPDRFRRARVSGEPRVYLTCATCADLTCPLSSADPDVRAAARW